jgi:hypothetical protein
VVAPEFETVCGARNDGVSTVVRSALTKSQPAGQKRRWTSWAVEIDGVRAGAAAQFQCTTGESAEGPSTIAIRSAGGALRCQKTKPTR